MRGSRDADQHVGQVRRIDKSSHDEAGIVDSSCLGRERARDIDGRVLAAGEQEPVHEVHAENPIAEIVASDDLAGRIDPAL